MAKQTLHIKPPKHKEECNRGLPLERSVEKILCLGEGDGHKQIKTATEDKKLKIQRVVFGYKEHKKNKKSETQFY